MKMEGDENWGDVSEILGDCQGSVFCEKAINVEEFFLVFVLLYCNLVGHSTTSHVSFNLIY